MSTHYFITGISTEVGKTICSAVITEALEADYFKPVQAGDLDYGDRDKIRDLISNSKTLIHSPSYELQYPMSPHAAAARSAVEIDIEQIIRPKTTNRLVIEGAGGLLVPLNQKETIADLIEATDKVILVSRHYLGSINHSLLSIQYLNSKGIRPYILFNGDENPETESIILKMGDVHLLGRMPELKQMDKQQIKRAAEVLKPSLVQL